MPSSRRTMKTKNGVLTYTPQTTRGRAAAKKIMPKGKGGITSPTRKLKRGGDTRVGPDMRGIIYSVQDVDKRAKSEGAMKRAATASRRKKANASGVAAQRANRAAYGAGTRRSR